MFPLLVTLFSKLGHLEICTVELASEAGIFFWRMAGSTVV